MFEIKKFFATTIKTINLQTLFEIASKNLSFEERRNKLLLINNNSRFIYFLKYYKTIKYIFFQLLENIYHLEKIFFC
jgi:hypothetical protein